MRLDQDQLIRRGLLKKQINLCPSADFIHHCLEKFCECFLYLNDIYQTIGEPSTLSNILKQRLLLHFCHAQVEDYSDFMHAVQKEYMSRKEGLSNPRQPMLTVSSVLETMTEAYFYEEINERVTDLPLCVDTIVNILHVGAEETQLSRNFRTLAIELQAIFSDLKKTTSRFSMRLENHLKYFELLRTMRESQNIRLLSILASIFLPLSLAAGLLSMRTRL